MPKTCAKAHLMLRESLQLRYISYNMSTGATDELLLERAMDRIKNLTEKFNTFNHDVKAGIYNTSAHDVAEQERSEQALIEAFRDLVFLFGTDETPPGTFSMNALQCIEFNPNSKFYTSKAIKHQSDQWWSRLKYNYDVEGTTVESDIFPIFGAYLDLHPRVSESLAGYSKSIVNVYLVLGLLSREHCR